LMIAMASEGRSWSRVHTVQVQSFTLNWKVLVECS